MHGVPHLMTCSFKTNVPHWPPTQMGVDPVRKDSLIRCPELTGSGHHTAAIDPYGKSKSESVLQRQRFRRQFSAAVERDWGGSRKICIDAGCGYSTWQYLRTIQPESPVFNM